jgi:iron complex outermembrane receptor protein
VFDNLSLDTGLSLMHSELGNADIEGAGGVIVPTDGKPQPYTPTVTFHGGAQYAFPILGDATLTPRIDFAYVGRQTMTPVDQIFNGIALDRTPPHRELNLKLTYATEQWNAEVYMTNATDDIYYEAHGGPGYNAYPNEPRRFGVLFHYNF